MAAGTYPVDPTAKQVKVTKPVVIEGGGRDETIIDGNNLDPDLEGTLRRGHAGKTPLAPATRRRCAPGSPRSRSDMSSCSPPRSMTSVLPAP